MGTRLTHPVTRDDYELDENDGSVIVSNDASRGRFGPTGAWIDGDLRTCDPQLVRWLHS
jgi:hypothetical protein